MGQLLAAVPEKARAEVFRFDAAGNLHEAEPESREYTRGNRLARKGRLEFTWDREGRLIERRERRADGEVAVTRYEWNGAGLLKSVTLPDGNIVDFAYDPFARRLWKRVRRAAAAGAPLEVTRFVRYIWDQDVLVHEVHEEARGSTAVVVEERTYAFSDDLFVPLAQKRGAWKHFLNDPIGTPVALVGADGGSVESVDRRVWGAPAAADRDRATRVGFPGQLDDDETGLAYNRFRYYDPDTGNYISGDPLRLNSGIRFYRYVANPTSCADPLGLVNLRALSDAQLMSRIDDFIDRDKRALGGGGTHGLSHRFREQIHGANGPGTPSWQNHEDQITGQQSGLRKCIAEYDRRVAGGTGMPPLRPDARPWSTKPPPAASDWVGPTPPPPPTGGGSGGGGTP